VIDTQAILLAICVIELFAILGLLVLSIELRGQLRAIEEFLEDTGAMPLDYTHLAESTANDHRP
jgi:hypothetical protein